MAAGSRRRTHAQGEASAQPKGNGNGKSHAVSAGSQAQGTSPARQTGYAAPLSMRRAATGLTIERYFTKPGVDPFDEVEWELRNAVIGNEKGGVVFEQKDIEVPKFWSQTATNVVASKYFRGTLGTPQREHSVRQLIDRVVRTIAGWGRAQGYFNTEEDARAYEAELKHLLVYQKMSFNSPVWFNIGIEPRPQGSACQPYHSRVLTASGPMPIGEIVEKNLVGLPVYDGEGLTQISAVKCNGKKPVFRIELHDGFAVEATGDHLVCAHDSRRTGRIEWRRVEDLKPGMVMRVYPHSAETVTPQGDPKEVAEAALAGWLQADGFVGQYEEGTNRSLTIEFMTNGSEEHEWVLGHMKTALPDIHFKVTDVETQDKDLKVRRIRLYGEVLRPFVQKYDLMRRGTEIRVPRAILGASNDAVAAYLKSVFQAEGYAMIHGESAHIALAVIAQGWARDLQVLLTRCGVYSRVRQKKEKREDRYDLWEVDISIWTERWQFARRVGFISSRKSGVLRESLELNGKECPDVRFAEIDMIRPLGEQMVYDIQTVSGAYLSDGVLVHNCFINSVEDRMDSILGLAKTEGMLFKYGSGTGTNLSPIRSSKELLAGGGTASGPVSFMKGYDAFAGVIKSGGKTRRAAKMVILNIDHPDVEEFIKCKHEEEKKAWALIDAGYSPALDGAAYSSVYFQNSNNSVRVTDEFMKAVEADGDWTTRAVTDGRPMDTYKARDLMRMIAEATWHCGDPGMQYDTTINDWHTVPNSGRINASNPCVTGDTLVATAEGLVPIRDLVGRKVVQIVGKDGDLVPVTEVFRTGIKPVFLLRTRAGYTLRVTQDHPVWTTNRGDVKAGDLRSGDLLALVPGRFGSERIPAAPAGDITLVDRYTMFEGGTSGRHSETGRRLTPAALRLDRDGTAALLRELFETGGEVSPDEDRGARVTLASASLALLRQVQQLLLQFGIKAEISESADTHLLGIVRNGRLLFERWIGFQKGGDKAARLREANEAVAAFNDPLTDPFDSLAPLGQEEVFDLTEPRTHHFVAGGLLVHNCSEYMHLDDSACNLASLNLMKLTTTDGELDVAAYRRAIDTTILAQEIIVDNASYPTAKIAQNSHDYRPLGLGYANLGALLMSRGQAYDSDSGRDYAAAITAVLTGEGYAMSARIAEKMGPFNGFAKNREPFLRVIKKHGSLVAKIDPAHVPLDLYSAAREVWDEAHALGSRHGIRNSQATVIAPTGTIAFMMDCDTTGIEPDIALIKYKKLVGGGLLKIVNNTVPHALERLGYSESQIKEMMEHVDTEETIEGAPHLEDQHLPVFDCAFRPLRGSRSIPYMGHIKMMAAVQPFVSGAISKTVNVPSDVTVDEITEAYLQSWKLGLKAVAIYRDGCKRTQPLSTSRDQTKTKGETAALAAVAAETIPSGPPRAVRRRLPVERRAITHKFSIAGHDGYITVGMYEDGAPGEIFLVMAKEGSVVSGLMDSFATAVSMALQYGVPLQVLVDKFSHVRFEPSGFSNNPEIPIAKSIVDYIFRWLASKFLNKDAQRAIGIQVKDDAPSLSNGAKVAGPVAVPSPDTSGAPSPAGGPMPITLVPGPGATGRGPSVMSGGPGGGPESVGAAGHDSSKIPFAFHPDEDAPPCPDCGSIMVRNAACYKCLNCGATSGCS
jgi:ribonucleoside-diphosphate reductase alpha chain